MAPDRQEHEVVDLDSIDSPAVTQDVTMKEERADTPAADDGGPTPAKTAGVSLPMTPAKDTPVIADDDDCSIIESPSLAIRSSMRPSQRPGSTPSRSAVDGSSRPGSMFPGHNDRKREANTDLEPESSKKQKTPSTISAQTMFDPDGNEWVSMGGYQALQDSHQRTLQRLKDRYNNLTVEIEKVNEKNAELQELLDQKTQDYGEVERKVDLLKNKILAVNARLQQMKDNDGKFREAFLAEWEPVQNKALQNKHERELARMSAKVEKAMTEVRETKALHRESQRELKADCEARIKDARPETSRLIKIKDNELRAKEARINSLEMENDQLREYFTKIVNQKKAAETVRLEAKEALKEKDSQVRDYKSRLDTANEQLLERLHSNSTEKKKLEEELQLERKKFQNQYDITTQLQQDLLALRRQLGLVRDAQKRITQPCIGTPSRSRSRSVQDDAIEQLNSQHAESDDHQLQEQPTFSMERLSRGSCGPPTGDATRGLYRTHAGQSSRVRAHSPFPALTMETEAKSGRENQGEAVTLSDGSKAGEQMLREFQSVMLNGHASPSADRKSGSGTGKIADKPDHHRDFDMDATNGDMSAALEQEGEEASPYSSFSADERS